MTLAKALKQALPDEDYLNRWISHREALEPLPTDFTLRWAPRVVEAYRNWLTSLNKAPDPLDRQEKFLQQLWENGQHEVRPELLAFLDDVYPGQSDRWNFLCSPDPSRATNFFSAWNHLKDQRTQTVHNRRLAGQLGEFHSGLMGRLVRARDGEEAVRALLSRRDFGWDLDDGITEEQDWAPLVETANQLEKSPELQRIAEIIGRDWREKRQPPNPPPQNHQQVESEPGKSEIRGVTWGRSWSDTLPQEMVLLGESTFATLFFLKEAEGRLLNWDYFTEAPPKMRSFLSTSRQQRNDRGPLIIALDTSGSMRGKPEQVAKACVLALTRVAWEENRACYLINFSAGVRTLDVTDLKSNLRPFLDFMKFSFHGGTDLTPALREALRILTTGRYRDADVLILSDFATPKIPAHLRQGIRDRQENAGTRFYSLTVSTRPLNDFLNIFDAGWIYDIHPDRPEGISDDSLRFSMD